MQTPDVMQINRLYGWIIWVTFGVHGHEFPLNEQVKIDHVLN